MRPLSVRARLTLWYFAVLATTLSLFAGGVFLAVRESVFKAVDEELENQLKGVRKLLEHEPEHRLADLLGELEEYSKLGLGGGLLQVNDSRGRWVYRPDSIRKYDLPSVLPGEIPQKYRRENFGSGKHLVRVNSSKVTINQEVYVVQAVVRLEEFGEVLSELGWTLVWGIPALLLLASAGGYWMSRRALRPVDEINRTARSISEHNLSQRLQAPSTGDELQRLSETLNEMLARLESAFRRITQFTADASHELRTPISLMRVTAEVALRKDRPATDYREALGQILRECEQTSRLIEDLLTLARADSGTATLRMAPMDLADSLREACRQVRRLCQDKQVQLCEAIAGDACPVEGDSEALRRVFLILLDNAVKYTGPGGRVDVGLAELDGFAVIEVRDTGIGISDQDLPNIFERFYRADKARSRTSGGAGLGLSIARWIVESHRGEVQVESALEQGSTFRIRLPLARRPD